MPRLTLQSKAFIALTALLVVLLAIFIGFARIGLQRGLGPYVAEIEIARMDWLVERLQTLHAETGSWDSLRGQPTLWRQLHRPWEWPPRNGNATGAGRRGEPNAQADSAAAPAADRTGDAPDAREANHRALIDTIGRPNDGGNPSDGDRRPRGNGGNGGAGDWPFPPPGFGPPFMPNGENGGNRGPRFPDGMRPPGPPGDGLAQRLGVVDDTGALVAGVAPVPGAARTTLRNAKGQAIGQFILLPPAGLEREADRAFLAQQLGFVIWTGFAGLLLALLLSWGLARRWLAPVSALVAGARGVAAGQLDTRVPVIGNDELAHLAHTFNDMAEQLATLEASRRRWIGDVAHELRTPLAAMRAEIEAVQDGVRSFDDKTALRLHRQVMRLIQLVGDLRASLDAAGGEAPTARVPVHPLALLAEAVATMQPRFDQAGVAIVDSTVLGLPSAQAAPLVRGDAQQLHRVFLNLLENSLRYTDAGGHLTLSAQVDRTGLHPQLTLRFDDTAPGVEPHDLPRLFERLFRAEASRTRSVGDLGGSGLGLAICRAIVQAHGGRITAEASPLGGLRITLTLPLLENTP